MSLRHVLLRNVDETKIRVRGLPPVKFSSMAKLGSKSGPILLSESQGKGMEKRRFAVLRPATFLYIYDSTDPDSDAEPRAIIDLEYYAVSQVEDEHRPEADAAAAAAAAGGDLCGGATWKGSLRRMHVPGRRSPRSGSSDDASEPSSSPLAGISAGSSSVSGSSSLFDLSASASAPVPAGSASSRLPPPADAGGGRFPEPRVNGNAPQTIRLTPPDHLQQAGLKELELVVVPHPRDAGGGTMGVGSGNVASDRAEGLRASSLCSRSSLSSSSASPSEDSWLDALRGHNYLRARARLQRTREKRNRLELRLRERERAFASKESHLEAQVEAVGRELEMTARAVGAGPGEGEGEEELASSSSSSSSSLPSHGAAAATGPSLPPSGSSLSSSPSSSSASSAPSAVRSSSRLFPSQPISWQYLDLEGSLSQLRSLAAALHRRCRELSADSAAQRIQLEQLSLKVTHTEQELQHLSRELCSEVSAHEAAQQERAREREEHWRALSACKEELEGLRRHVHELEAQKKVLVREVKQSRRNVLATAPALPPATGGKQKAEEHATKTQTSTPGSTGSEKQDTEGGQGADHASSSSSSSSSVSSLLSSSHANVNESTETHSDTVKDPSERKAVREDIDRAEAEAGSDTKDTKLILERENKSKDSSQEKEQKYHEAEPESDKNSPSSANVVSAPTKSNAIKHERRESHTQTEETREREEDQDTVIHRVEDATETALTAPTTSVRPNEGKAMTRPPSGLREAGLPEGWRKIESRSRPGCYYYANATTGQTTWQRPTKTASEHTSALSTDSRRNGLEEGKKYDQGMDHVNSFKSKMGSSLTSLRNVLSSRPRSVGGISAGIESQTLPWQQQQQSHSSQSRPYYTSASLGREGSTLSPESEDDAAWRGGGTRGRGPREREAGAAAAAGAGAGGGGRGGLGADADADELVSSGGSLDLKSLSASDDGSAANRLRKEAKGLSSRMMHGLQKTKERLGRSAALPEAGEAESAPVKERTKTERDQF